MTIIVHEDWWKTIFDELYLQTDARSVCDDNLTRMEVDFLQDVLKPSRFSHILDLCGGQGRHSLELSRRGFDNVTVLDYSSYLLDLGKNKAHRENLCTSFLRGDARTVGLKGHCFTFIIVMASSFGYFVEETENRKVIREIYRLLVPGGMLLLDLPYREFVLRNFKNESVHQIDGDLSVRRIREQRNGVIYSREIVMSAKKGKIRDNSYCIRLFSVAEISALLASVGFADIRTWGDFMCRADQGDFGCMTNRMIILAQKRP